MTPFKAPRSLLKSLLFIVLSAAAGGIFFLVFSLLHQPSPQSFFEKLGEVVLFCLCAAGIGFSVAFFAAGIRDLLEKPAFEISDEQFRIFGDRSLPLSELESVETEPGRDGKKAKALIFRLKNGETKRLPASETCVPLETLAYAVSLRLK